MGSLKRSKHGPEWYIQRDLKDLLRARAWHVEQTHGNLFQTGFPDLFVSHKKFGSRWIDCKVDGKYEFTIAQQRKWPIWTEFGVGIWILTAATQEQYDRLFRPPNWRDYWKPKYGIVPVEELLRQLDAAEEG